MTIHKGNSAVAILMPVHNEEHFLPAALDSLTHQTFTDWQLIAIDDCSSDATPEILATAAAREPRITVIRPSQRGLVSALNAGLEFCTAPYIARMDGDDISHPDRLAAQYAFLKNHPDIGLVACSFRHFPRSSLKDGMRIYESWQNALCDHSLIMRDILVESPFVHPSIMCKTEVIRNLGGYRNLGWPEDYDLWLRMAADGVRFARLPQPLFFWRDHPERATRTMDEYSRDAFRRCKCEYLCSQILINSRQVVIAGTGIEGRAWQRLLAERGITVAGWIDVDPKKRGRNLHNAPVLLPDDYVYFQDIILIAIGVIGAREQFRHYLLDRGLTELYDFIAVS